MILPFSSFQDTNKIVDLTKESEESTNLIPQLEEDIPKLQKLLVDEEKVLEEIKENAKGTSLSFKFLTFALSPSLPLCIQPHIRDWVHRIRT